MNTRSFEIAFGSPKPRVQSSSLCAPAKENPRKPSVYAGSEDFSFSHEIQIMSVKSPIFPHFPRLPEQKRCQLGVKIT